MRHGDETGRGLAQRPAGSGTDQARSHALSAAGRRARLGSGTTGGLACRMTVAGNSSVSASAIFYSCADNHSRRTVDSPRNQRPIDAYDGRDRVGRLLCLARISAERGLERDCREYVSWARYIANACGWVGLEARACGVLGLLEVGLGKFAAAVEQFDSCARMLAGAEREDSDELVWAADQVEALIALARYPRAAEVCRSEQVRAERTRSRLVYASAARCRALIADTESFVMEFEATVRAYRSVPDDFELARAQLCFGERLRRERRSVDARAQLGSALSTFERLAAVPWAERARRELEATVRHRNCAGDPDALTGREMQVAMMMADGATVREAANRLFISAKTVEAHLSRAYRKLGVRNRAQLVRALTASARPMRTQLEPEPVTRWP